MAVSTLLSYLNSPAFARTAQTLYGQTEVASARQRYKKLIHDAQARFPAKPEELKLFSVPGRTELAGNHTDHNHGKVIAASIQLDAIACVSKRDDQTVFFSSDGYPDITLDVSQKAPVPAEKGTTAALIRGMASQCAGRGMAVGGFNAYVSSQVLSGSGLSSSATMEILIGIIFDTLYGQKSLSAIELAQMGQKAENLFFGKPCGLMDQLACAFGGVIAIDFAQPAAPLVKKANLELAEAGYALCVVDTGGSHANLTPDYAAIPAEMKQIARFFKKDQLADLDRATVMANIATLRAAAGDRAVLRAMHFFAENDRVDAMHSALKKADAAGKKGLQAEKIQHIRSFLALAAQSGLSSWTLLQNVFSPQAAGEQGIALALALTNDFIQKQCQNDGICRVHGGGFAGTIQAVIPVGKVKKYLQWVKPVFGDKAVTVLRIRPVGALEICPHRG